MDVLRQNTFFSKNVDFYVFWDAGADAFNFSQKTDFFEGPFFGTRARQDFDAGGRLRRSCEAQNVSHLGSRLAGLTVRPDT